MKSVKAVSILLLIIGISILHIQTSAGEYGLHILHQQLFFIPIILAGFWFGLRIGLITTLLICSIYAPLIISHGGQHTPTTYPVLLTQLALYIFVSALIGWLSDRQQKLQKTLLTGTRATVLARAAATISFEIQEVAGSLDKIHLRATGLKDPGEDQNFQQELERLNHLLEVLVQYVPAEEQTTLSTDLNQLLESTYKKCNRHAKKSGIELVLQMDNAGCPSMVITESFSRILESLIENAIEVSDRGGKIFLTSKRGSSICYLDVTDEGPGVSETNLKKLFKPFFTTKPEGTGLSLSSGRKGLKDAGGDLVYIPGTVVGSTFRMIVPRENVEKNVDEFVRMQKLKSLQQ